MTIGLTGGIASGKSTVAYQLLGYRHPSARVEGGEDRAATADARAERERDAAHARDPCGRHLLRALEGVEREAGVVGRDLEELPEARRERGEALEVVHGREEARAQAAAGRCRREREREGGGRLEASGAVRAGGVEEVEEGVGGGVGVHGGYLGAEGAPQQYERGWRAVPGGRVSAGAGVVRARRGRTARPRSVRQLSSFRPP